MPDGHSYLAIEHNRAGELRHLPTVSTSLPATGSARDLAENLVPHLETVANLHYLLDLHVGNPMRLKELRAIEDHAFSNMLELVLSHLPKTKPLLTD